MPVRSKKKRYPPRIRDMKEHAVSSGYEPGKIACMFLGESQSRIENWYKALKSGIVPEDFENAGMTTERHLEKAWETFFKEAASMMEVEKDWAEFFHGKLQRIESTVVAKVESKVISSEPLSEDEWQQRYGLEPAGGASEGTD